MGRAEGEHPFNAVQRDADAGIRALGPSAATMALMPKEPPSLLIFTLANIGLEQFFRFRGGAIAIAAVAVRGVGEVGRGCGNGRRVIGN
jgi:hypothetical protein